MLATEAVVFLPTMEAPPIADNGIAGEYDDPITYNGIEMCIVGLYIVVPQPTGLYEARRNNASNTV